MPAGPMPGIDGTGLIMNVPGLSTLSVGIVEYGPNGAVTLPIYRWTIVGYALLGLACYWLAGHLIRPRRRWRIGWHDLVMLGSLAIVFAVGTRWLGLWPALAQRIGL